MPEVELQPLRVLCAIVETRSVSRAAELLGITQPAASYLLAKLRTVLHDPLFVKSSKGMSPTPRATAVYQEVRRGIDMLDSALSPVGFDPWQSERNFRLAMSDIGEMVFLPPILRKLRTLAPKLTIEVTQVPLLELPRALDFGDVDFGMGNLPQICPETSHVTVFREHYVCLFRRGHGDIGKTLSRRTFERLDHVIVSSPFTGHHVVERSLVEQGVRRRASLRIANYTSVPDVVAQTDLAVLIPSRVARAFEVTHGLRWLPLPVSVPSFDVRIHWSARHQSNEGHQWMRKVLADVLREL